MPQAEIFLLINALLIGVLKNPNKFSLCVDLMSTADCKILLGWVQCMEEDG